ncbi:hypothetical protein JYQ62_05790 [Nostoc sp. UHCC 0702]|nr:hypothetical protein JYQ62_05790 [Nostoc sp. UHCC 0702]
MIKPVSDQWRNSQSDRTDADHQALDDFGITQLLTHISNYSDSEFDASKLHLTEEELESIAVFADTAWEQDIEPLDEELA